MRKPSADPLAGTGRLLIDGSNLLHALRRDGAGAPPAALIGRLRGVVPATVGIELVLDGPPEPGLYGARVASGLIVRHGGRRTGDDVLLRLVEAGTAGGRGAADQILVVTDDRQLRVALGARGVRTAGTRWLLGRLERGRLSAPSTGNARGPAPLRGGPEGPESREDDRPGWRPGRGATTKHGNPRRRPKGFTG